MAASRQPLLLKQEKYPIYSIKRRVNGCNPWASERFKRAKRIFEIGSCKNHRI
jgi:hypothetical protein